MMEGILSHILRNVAENYLLVPTANTGIPSYYFLNRTSADIFALMNEGHSYIEILNYFLNLFPSMPRDKISNDIADGYNKLVEIINSKRVNEQYNASKESQFRQTAHNLHLPIEGAIELTFKCNLKCNHCYCVHCEWPKHELTTQQWIDHIDDIANNGCVWLLITGGEPLLRKDFAELFLHAKNCGMITTVFTNGLLITEQHCHLFYNNPPHLLEITVYGLSDDTYHRVTGNKNGFSQLKAALDLLDKHHINYSLKTTITSDNSNELLQMKEFAQSRRAYFRHDSNIFNRLDGLAVPQGIALPPKDSVDAEFIDSIDQTIEAWETTRQERKLYFQEKLFFCSAGKISFNIDPFGNASVCGRVRKLSVSLLDTSFANAWENLNKFAQQPVPNNFRCRTCATLEYCKPCPASADLSADQLDLQCQSARRRADIIQSSGVTLGS